MARGVVKKSGLARSEVLTFLLIVKLYTGIMLTCSAEFSTDGKMSSDERRCELYYVPWIDKDWPKSDAANQASSKSENDLRLIVFTFRRAKSFLRLIDSLMNASYVNDVVALDILLDR
jgi:hypothetical protein